MQTIYSILLCLAIFFSGCVSVGHKIDQSAADKIEKGKTTRAEVINLIGSPDNITRTSNGNTIFTYNYMRATPKASNFIPVVGPLVGGANVQHQMYMVTFDSNGIVKDFASTYGGTQADTGLSTATKAEMPDIETNKRPK